MHDLSQRLIRAHEAERARLGRELHDDVKQRLAVLAISAGRVDRGAIKSRRWKRCGKFTRVWCA